MKYNHSQFSEKVYIVRFEKCKSLSKVIERGEVFQRLKKFLFKFGPSWCAHTTGICAKIRKKLFLADKWDFTKEALPKAKDFSSLKKIEAK